MYQYINKIKITFEYVEGVLLNPDNGIRIFSYNNQIYDYKEFSGKVQELLRNVIYEEDDFLNKQDIVIFEGEYIKGKRNGKGKEYNENGSLIYEGEFKDGKRNGHGKEYYNNNVLIFEGEYLNGEKNGNGKEYNTKGILIFEGEFQDGQKRKGKEYNENNIIFDGEFQNGKEWNGKKNIYNEKYKLWFDGKIKNGKKNGNWKEYVNGKVVFEENYLFGNKIETERNGKK